MVDNKRKKTIGRVERVSFPVLGASDIHARIDTGARTSAIWVSKAVEKDGRLEVVFFGPSHPQYTGKTIYFDSFTQGVVATSTGQKEERYKIRTSLKIAGKTIRARLTLADRSSQVYPVLIGRNVLRGKFVVDVNVGEPLMGAEKDRSRKLQGKD